MSLSSPALLAEKATYTLDLAKRAGAEQAQVVLSESLGESLSWRNQAVENITRERDIGLSLIVYNEQREGSTSISDWSDSAIAEAVKQAMLASDYNEKDPYNGLPDAAYYAQVDSSLCKDLQLVDSHAFSLPDLEHVAQEMEAAALDYDERIVMSDGVHVDHSNQQFFLATSNGFANGYQGSRQQRSLSVLARDNLSQQTNYDYDVTRHIDDARAPNSLGQRAACKAIERLNPRKITGGRYPVLFDASVAQSLIGHLLQALGGRSQYRQLSFLTGALGQVVLPDWFTLVEEPHRPRGLYSAPFDAEGLATSRAAIINQGKVAKYLLDSYSARRLGLEPTANAGGVRNVSLAIADDYLTSKTDLYRHMQRGVVVTQLMGQGVNILTGDYSRGAAGFWVENGEIVHAVEGITIAGNLKDIFKDIIMVGDDIDYRGRLLLPSILVNSMTVAQ